MAKGFKDFNTDKVISKLEDNLEKYNKSVQDKGSTKEKEINKYIDSLDDIEYSNNEPTIKYIEALSSSKEESPVISTKDSKWNKKLKNDLDNLEIINSQISFNRINLNKYRITRYKRPIIKVPIIRVEHNYVINMKEFESHRNNSWNKKNPDTREYLGVIPSFDPVEYYRETLSSMSTEARIVRYYKTKLYSNGDINTYSNPMVDNLRERLNPTDRKEGESISDYNKRLAISAVQSFYTNDKKDAPVHKIKSGKDVIKVDGIRVDTLSASDNKNFGKGSFTFSVRNVISMGMGNFLGNNKHGQFVRPHIELNSGIHNYKILYDESSKKINLRESLSKMARSYNNSAVKCLLRSMPNFAPNMYYGVFSQINLNDDPRIIEDLESISNNIGEEPIGYELGKSSRNVLDTYQVRLQSISVPKVSLSKSDISFMGRKVPKISSKFREEHTATMTFSLDQNGLILRQFNILAGIQGYGKDGDMDNSKYSNLINMNNSGKLYPKTFFPSTFFECSNENKGKRLDLTVMYNDYRTLDRYQVYPHNSSFKKEQTFITKDSGLVEDIKQDKVLGSYNSYRAFIFEDVKVLGSSSPIQFERDSSKTINVQISILFKRIRTLDANP